MEKQIPLQEAIGNVLQSLRDAGYSELTLIDTRRKYNRLIKLAEQKEEIYFSGELATLFLNDSKNQETGDYCHSRFLAHNRCVRYLQSYLETGQAVIEPYHTPTEDLISDGLLEPLLIYDQGEALLGLSENTLKKNRRPIQYLLEFMTGLGYRKLSDIQHGDTTKAIECMIEKHYSATSIGTVLSGMRRFYEMFQELHPFRMEIPVGLPKKQSIIEVYTDEEQEKILTWLCSSEVSFRDKTICLLSFETGLRSVDICNLRLKDVDWRHDTLHIIQSKTKKPLTLPLRSSYGNAMAEYLLKERPVSTEEYVFLTVNAPHKKLESTWNIIKSAVSAAGIDTNGRITGTRMFRHNVASTMLKKGVPLPTIAEELGHRSQDSTMIYISTDQEILSSLTLPFPNKGGAKK